MDEEEIEYGWSPSFPGVDQHSGLTQSGDDLAWTEYQSGYQSFYGTTSVYSEHLLEYQKQRELDDRLCTVPGAFMRDNEQIQLKVNIFVSRHESNLSSQYDATTPYPNEICIFLEDNTGDLMSSRSYFVKIGDDYRRYLAQLKSNGDVSGYVVDEPYFDYDGGDNALVPEFTSAEIEELINTGALVEPKTMSIGDLIYVLNIASVVLEPIYGGISYALSEASKGVKDFLKFKPGHYDPGAITDPGEEFTPILFSLFPEVDGSNIVWAFTKGIETWRDAQISRLNLLDSIDFSGLPSIFGNFGATYNTVLLKVKTLVSDISATLIANITSFKDFFLKVGNKVRNLVNAYYCGLWNSLVDSVMGIVDIIALLFKGMQMSGQVAGNADAIIHSAKEMLDEAIQIFNDTSWTELFATIISKAASGISSMFGAMGSFLSVTMEKIAYFVGAIAGFILELVLVVATGGTSLAAIIPGYLSKAFGSFKVLSGIFSFIETVVTNIDRAIDVVVGTILTPIFKVIGWLFSVLRKGVAYVARSMDDFFRGLKGSTVIPNGTVDDIFRSMGFVDGRGVFEAKGYRIVDADNGQIVFKPNC